jgi:predicted PurR-regulated permease PerM
MTRIDIPARTVIKVLAIVVIAAILIWFIGQIRQILLEIFLAALIATALGPVVGVLERWRLRRPVAVIIVVLALCGLVALFLWLILPPLINQSVRLIDNFPDYSSRIQRWLGRENPDLLKRIQEAGDQTKTNPGRFVDSILQIGTGAAQRFVSLIITLIMAVYLLLDGERVINWGISYLPPRQRIQARMAIPEMKRVISGYVIGQSALCLLFGIFTFIVLTAAGVPQPLLLAVVAAVTDAIPNVGIMIATIPAVLVAFSVSLPTAIAVLVCYVVYQLFENYVLSPRIFGKTLQVNPFAILVGILIGGTILGILGVLLALPVTAAIPVIERIVRTEIHEDEVEAERLAATSGPQPTRYVRPPAS